MNDIDTRLRETLDTVAGATKSHERLGEISRPEQGGRTRLRMALAGFAVVVLAIGVPALVGSIREASPIASSPDATLPRPEDSTSTPDQVTLPGGIIVPPADAWGPPQPVTDPGWALVPSWFTVEAGDLDDIPVTAAGEPTLRMDWIWCLFADGSATQGKVRPAEYGGSVTEDDLYAACEERRNGGPAVMPATMTFCRGVFTTSREMVETGQLGIVEGNLSAPGPGFVVGVGWESDCVSENPDTNPRVKLTDDLSLEDVNRARQMDLAVTTASFQVCFSYHQAHEVASEARRLLGGNWMHFYVPLLTPESEECYRPWFDPQNGWIVVWGR